MSIRHIIYTSVFMNGIRPSHTLTCLTSSKKLITVTLKTDKR